MKLTILTSVAALGLSACAGPLYVADTGEAVPAGATAPFDAWPTEFAGRTVEIVTPDGITNVVNLAPDGTMSILPEFSTAVAKGTWGQRGDALCVNFAPRGEECWNAAAVIAANGEYVKLRSDRGQQLSVRLLDESEEDLVERGG
jgi:hypothetical protein